MMKSFTKGAYYAVCIPKNSLYPECEWIVQLYKHSYSDEAKLQYCLWSEECDPSSGNYLNGSEHLAILMLNDAIARNL